MSEEPKNPRGALGQYYQTLDERWALSARTDRARRWLPFAFFVGGFLFDVLTLGRMVTMINLVGVALYAVGAGAFLVVLGRFSARDAPLGQELSGEDIPAGDPEEPAGQKWLRWCGFAFNFCLGSLFSALVVLYFKSAGEWLTLLTVLLLFGGMVFNEFARLDDSQRHLSWAIYCVSLVMLFNFVVPHLVGSISAWWFYISTVIGVGAVYGLCWLAGHSFRMVRVATVSSLGLVGLFVLGWIPPVPLVLKNTLIGRDYQKVDGQYTCMVDAQPFWVRVGLDDPTVAWKPGERVDVLTAIFAPKAVEVDMEHRWFHEVQGAWKLTDTIPFHMRGGREKGWRMHSAKRHLSPGRWKVETAVANGTGLGYKTFIIEETDAPRRCARQIL